MKKTLTIAGSDCSGGAGIQADIKTMTVHNVYGMSVITALTAQNTLGVTGIVDVDKNFVKAQLEAVFTDIAPDSIKVGMVSSSDIIKTIAKTLDIHRAKNIVVDPVMVATSGALLISEQAKESLVKELFPLASIITPNLMEAEELSGIKIENEEKMIEAAKHLSKLTPGAILIKGGHFRGGANDLLYTQGELMWFKHFKVKNENTHGTGCTLSSAIASNLANGYGLVESVRLAKEFITKLIEDKLDLGRGRGPLNHMALISLDKES